MALVSAIAQSQDAPNIAEPSTVGLLAGAALAWRSCVGTYTAIRGLAMDIDDQWTVKSEADWPGAEYTRRTRLKTRCEEPYNAAFLDEVKSLTAAAVEGKG